MATAPVKSQPLHNFSLPYLRWGHKNQTNNNHHRFRRPSELTRDSTPPPPLPQQGDRHRSSPSEHDSDGGSRNDSETDSRKLPFGSRNSRKPFPFSSCSTQKHRAVALEGESNEGDADRGKACDEVEVEESAAKPWNLRPRKAVAKVATEIGKISKNGEVQETGPAVASILAGQQSDNHPKSLRLRGFTEGQGFERKEKRKFWISLSREEIEEDVYSMTGLKPARRPKKRPKNVQKQLDSVFPGLYLAGISADAYRVYDALR